MYIDTGSSVPGVPSKSRDLADENNKIWKPHCVRINDYFYESEIYFVI